MSAFRPELSPVRAAVAAGTCHATREAGARKQVAIRGSTAFAARAVGVVCCHSQAATPMVPRVAATACELACEAAAVAASDALDAAASRPSICSEDDRGRRGRQQLQRSARASARWRGAARAGALQRVAFRALRVARERSGSAGRAPRLRRHVRAWIDISTLRIFRGRQNEMDNSGA